MVKSIKRNFLSQETTYGTLLWEVATLLFSNIIHVPTMCQSSCVLEDIKIYLLGIQKTIIKFVKRLGLVLEK